MTKLDQMLADIREFGMQGLLACGTPALPHLLDRACNIFETYPLFDQSLAMSIMLGQVFATIEGDDVEMERGTGAQLIGMEERLQIFCEAVRTIYKEAYAFRSHPDCPNPIKRTM